MSGGVLYVSYSGMLEPLGQSQVLAYQENLAADHPVHLVSFERPEDWARINEREVVAQRMRTAGIHWHPLRYHKRFSFLATAWDILCGSVKGLCIVRKHRLTIVHARSYVSSVMALMIKRATGAKYVFDMRGFWADERVDGGLWSPSGRMYRVAKWFERRFLLSADHVISLTQAGVDEMRKFPYLREGMPPVTVIPTCADLARFKPLALDKGTQFVLGYVGSAGTWYLFDVVAACFQQLLTIRPDATLLIINREEHGYIVARLAAAGVPEAAFEIRSVDHADVPREMARMHAGVFFIKPVFSKQASAPTKLGEFLGCGIPCLSNRGVGDMASLLEGEQVGVALAEFDTASLLVGVESLLKLVALPEISARCVQSAHRHFSLDEGVARYQAVYESLE
ncbi:glycosyltransferase [Pseudoxanthomonas gei]|uniref:Glycosyltransferase n=1 Tax=Pseudoxanthomonas gei TaxID=1383030 RepID=A0ABX0AAY6_9GAMM|nr:glycosyltransferase [Pseudoxanthomonas gei]NDK38719.1 glycosyltransferase [Pseudoxanthomonas gei]